MAKRGTPIEATRYPYGLVLLLSDTLTLGILDKQVMLPPPNESFGGFSDGINFATNLSKNFEG